MEADGNLTNAFRGHGLGGPQNSNLQIRQTEKLDPETRAGNQGGTNQQPTVKYTYNTTLSRFDDDGNQEILIDHDITPDEAVTMMIDRLEPHDITMADPEPGFMSSESIGKQINPKEEEDEDELESKPKKISVDIEQREGPDWDVEMAKLEIKLGKKKAVQIAKELDVPVQRIYTLKYQLKQDGELESNDPPVAEVLQNRIIDMINNGMDDQEIINQMSASMSNREIQEAIAWAKKNES